MSDDTPLKKGVDGRFVVCRPLPEDPLVIEQRHRASCLLQPTPRCHTCKNSKFTLFFEPAEKRQECILCPRWADGAARLHGKLPVSYVVTELATCAEKPFEFCPSCPSQEDLSEIGIDKAEEGWYGIWKRAMELAFEEDGDG